MTTFVRQIIAALVRAALLWLSGWLVAHGLPGISEDQIAQIIAPLVPMVIALGWSIYQKYHGRLKFHTALESPPGTTEAQVDAKIKLGIVPAKVLGVVLVGSFVLQGCAVRLTPLRQAQITKSSLDAAFDLEASLCWGVASVHLGPADRTKCTAPTAKAIGLTDARHQEINRGFTRAYLLHYDATRLLRAGEKADLVELAKAISSLVSQILQLQQTPEVKELAETVQKGAIK